MAASMVSAAAAVAIRQSSVRARAGTIACASPPDPRRLKVEWRSNLPHRPLRGARPARGGLLTGELHQGWARRQVAVSAEQDAAGRVVELCDPCCFAASVGRDRLTSFDWQRLGYGDPKRAPANDNDHRALLTVAL